MFVLDIELGSHVYIPKYLSMRNFSIASRYYDPIINIVKEYGHIHKKEHFNLSSNMNLQRVHQDSIKQILFKKMIGSEKKMTFKLKDCSVKYLPNDVDYFTSEHSTQLQ